MLQPVRESFIQQRCVYSFLTVFVVAGNIKYRNVKSNKMYEYLNKNIVCAYQQEKSRTDRIEILLHH